jgi:perosamine synthetase
MSTPSSRPVEDRVRAFVDGVRRVVGDAPRVALHEPDITEAERLTVDDCLQSTFVSSVGPYVTRFENEIAAYTGARHAIAVSNGTSALHVALVLAGVQAGDLVLVPTLSFIATANAVSHAGAIPHFIDSDPRTLGMSAAAVAAVLENAEPRDGALIDPGTGRRIAAIVPMHTFGHPVEIEVIIAVADRFGVPVVEDAAESLGSTVGGRHTGTFGQLGVLSFNGNKIVTTGGGGMILTDDDELGRRAKHLTTTAKVPHEWEFEHDEVAWNYRMPNINAALGVAQLGRLGGFLQEKRILAQRYQEVFATIEGADVVAEPDGTVSNYWLVTIELQDADLALRDAVLRAANDDGLQCRPTWNLLHRQLPYRNAPHAATPVAEKLADTLISVPSSPKLAGRA